jgi:hypothetical protein
VSQYAAGSGFENLGWEQGRDDNAYDIRPEAIVPHVPDPVDSAGLQHEAFIGLSGHVSPNMNPTFEAMGRHVLVGRVRQHALIVQVFGPGRNGSRVGGSICRRPRPVQSE